jgi:hypothetical protein
MIQAMRRVFFVASATALAIALAVFALTTTSGATSVGCAPGTVRAGVCHGRTTAPTVCSMGTPLDCGLTAAAEALRIFESGGKSDDWHATIKCIVFGQLLHYRCTFHNATQRGIASVSFASKSPWTPKVTVG